MKDLISELLKRYGSWTLLAAALIFTIIWLAAHFIAAPGGSVSVLWGLVNYTKRGELPGVSGSTESAEIVLTPKQHRLLSLIADYQKETGRDYVSMRDDGYADGPNFRDMLYGTDKPTAPEAVQAREFPDLIADMPEVYLHHYYRERGFKVTVTEAGFRYLAKYE